MDNIDLNKEENAQIPINLRRVYEKFKIELFKIDPNIRFEFTKGHIKLVKNNTFCWIGVHQTRFNLDMPLNSEEVNNRKYYWEPGKINGRITLYTEYDLPDVMEVVKKAYEKDSKGVISSQQNQSHIGKIDEIATEAVFEDRICEHPDLIEDGLKLVSRQRRMKSGRLDLLFEDKFGKKLLVELKNGPITRNAIGQALDYEGDIYDADIRTMLIGAKVPLNIQRALDNHGIEWKEITPLEIKKHIEEHGKSNK